MTENLNTIPGAAGSVQRCTQGEQSNTKAGTTQMAHSLPLPQQGITGFHELHNQTEEKLLNQDDTGKMTVQKGKLNVFLS